MSTGAPSTLYPDAANNKAHAAASEQLKKGPATTGTTFGSAPGATTAATGGSTSSAKTGPLTGASIGSTNSSATTGSSSSSAKPGSSTAATALGGSARNSTAATASSSSSAAAPSTSTSSTAARGAHTFRGFDVPHILTWENPAATGLVLVEALALFVVFSSTLTLRWALKLASIVIGILSVAEWGSRAISGQRSGLISSYQPSRFLPLSERVINNVAQYVSVALRRVIFGVQHLVDAREPVKGLKLAGALYVAHTLLGLFTLKGLFLTSIIVAFTVPFLYLQFKPEVDRAIGEAQGHLHQHARNLQEQAHAKAGPQIDYLKKFVGPRGGFDTTKNVAPVGEVPTAGAKPTEFTRGTNATAAPFSTAGIPTAGAGGLGASGISGASGVSAGSAAPKPATTHVPDEVFKHFDTVPTLVGSVPIDQQKLSAALAADKAKAEGAVSGL